MIFGKDGDKLLQQKLLCDYVNAHPEGKEAGAKRGKVDLTSYMHTVGARSTVDDFESYSKLDYEAFLRNMEVARGWNMSRASEEWETLGNRPVGQQGPEVAQEVATQVVCAQLADGR
jgi:hypothetical protein